MSELTFDATVHEPSYAFDFGVLRQFSPRELNAWLKDNYNQIQKTLIQRFSFLNSTFPDTIQTAARIPYLKDAYDAAVGIDFDNCESLPFVHLFALFGLARKTGSCHEVLFGEAKPVVLRGQTLSVLDLFVQAPEALQHQVISQLYDAPSHVTNPAYISYYRYDELAKEEGKQVNQWFVDYYSKAELFSQIVKFKEEALKPQDPLRSFRLTNLWWMALMVCPVLDLSADFLFREDYSNIAVRPDREISDYEKLFLGGYLSASRDAQRNCRYALAYEKMLRKDPANVQV